MVTDAVGRVHGEHAHPVADGWTYGFPELCAEQKALVRGSKRIANPGCYPRGMIALTRPAQRRCFRRDVRACVVPPCRDSPAEESS